jgi:hypothetical protein
VRYALQNDAFYSMKTRGLRSNSRPHRFASIDRRTGEGRAFERFRAELVEYVGGTPSIVQSAIIERCAWVRLRIALMDEKMLAGGMTEQDGKSYLAWCNTLARLLGRLGVQPATAPVDPMAALNAHLANIADRRVDPDYAESDDEAA